MGECLKNGCTAQATKTRARYTTDAERNEQVNEEGGLSWNFIVEIYVCDEHLEEAEKEFPLVVNKEPYT